MTNEGERIARLETKMEHMADTIDKMSAQVDQLVALMNAAKGARWFIVAVASVAGFFAGKLGAFFGFFPAK